MSWRRSCLAVVALVLLPFVAPAMAETPWSACFEAAGRHHRLAPALLAAIAEQESGFDPAASHVNADGSRDVGLMQINDRWLPRLAAWGIRSSELLDPCTSIWVGAWILAGNVAVHGYGWEAVGEYNAGASSRRAARRAAYAQRIHRRLERGVDAGTGRVPTGHAPRRTGIAEFAIAASDAGGAGGAAPAGD